MKAIVIYEPGGPEKLLFQEVPTPKVRPGWSLVQVKGFGINHSEIFTRKGLSCVGLIAETTDPKRLPVGMKVISIMGEMGRAFDGGYAEYTLLPNEQIYPVETALDWPTLAALPETCYTAYGSLKSLRIEEGHRVLVRGATSGVGIAFVRLLKARWPDIHITGTSRSLRKEAQLREAGFDEVIVDKGGVLQTVERFDRALELIGPATLKDTFSHISEGGIVCSTGQLGGQWYMDGFDPITDLCANGYLTSFYSANVDAERLQEMLDWNRCRRLTPIWKAPGALGRWLWCSKGKACKVVKRTAQFGRIRRLCICSRQN